MYSNTDEHGGRLMYEYRYKTTDDAPTYSGDHDEILDNPEDASERTVYDYDGMGRQVYVADEVQGAGTSGWAGSLVVTDTTTGYDPDTGELISVETELSGNSLGTVNYEYNDLGQKIRTYTDNNDTYYEYDKQGRLEKLKVAKLNGEDIVDENDDPAFLTTIYTYDLVGNLESTQHTDADGEVVTTTTYTYDDLNRLTNEEVKNGDDVVIASYSYTLNYQGLRTAVVEHQMNVDNVTFSDVKVSYAYNQNGRLTKEFRDVATYSGTTPVFSSTPFTPDSTGDFVDTYAFDLNGNRLEKEHEDYGTNDYTTSYTHNERDQLTTEDSDDNTKDKSYEYDANGNQVEVSEGTGTPTMKYYLWEMRNRLVGIDLNNDQGIGDEGETLIVYDVDGVRIHESTVDGETFKYLNDPNNPTGYTKAVEEENIDTHATRSFVLGHKVEAQSDSTNGTLYLLSDGRGATRATVDLSGEIVQRYDFDAYLKLLNMEEGAAITQWLAPDGKTDAAIGLRDNLGRWVDEARFISFDPAENDHADPLHLHKYNYTPGNPLSYMDASGHDYTLTGVLVAAAIGISLGTIDGLLQGHSGWDLAGDAAIGGLVGISGYAIFGASTAYYGIRFIQAAALGVGTGLGITGTYAAYLEENYKLAVFRGATTILGTISGLAALLKSSTSLELAAIADEALGAIGPGKGGAWGAKVHGEAARIIERSGRTDLSTEVWYRNGRVLNASENKSGAVRLDVVEGDIDNPTAIYDFKFNSATLEAKRVTQIQDHLPIGSKNIPIVEIRAPGN